MSIDFEKATSEELIQWKIQNAEELEKAGPSVRAQLEGIIAQKIGTEGFSKAKREFRKLESGKQWDKQAETDWPELKDRESDLYKETVKAMEEDPNASMEDPYAYYNHATRIGISLGMLPAGTRPKRNGSDPMGDIGAGEGAGAKEAPEPGKEFLEKTKKIQDAYADILDMSDKGTRERIARSAEEMSND